MAEVTACPGEYEPVSLVLWATESLPELLVEAGDLHGPNGTIAADNVDIKWVKCWYQGGNAPYGIAVQHKAKTLIPELLLNDDTLVRVDMEDEHNSLKLKFPDGPRYVPIDSPEVVATGTEYTLDEFPVQDSNNLQPIDLPAQFNKQVWITIRVPRQTPPGQYRGHLRINSTGQTLAQVQLRVRVLPFELPAPKTHYDADGDFTYSLYYWGELDASATGKIGFKHKSRQQFLAELQYMYDHGIVAPAMIWWPPVVYDKHAGTLIADESLLRESLRLMQQVGMSGRPLMAEWGDWNTTDPEELRQVQQYVRRVIAIAGEYGFTEVYFYGIDEATGERLKSQRKAWEAVHEVGAKVFVSGFEGQLEIVGDILNLFNRCSDPELGQTAEWHRQGHKIWNYANPQTPVEDPEIYRRNYGLFLWRLDYDGECTYCFMCCGGGPWNDFSGQSFRQHNIAYPIVDGVVGTLAMEGFREAVDDVKYATAFRSTLAEAQERGSAPPKVQEVATWLEEVDLKKADLDEVRQKMISAILDIMGTDEQ